MRSDLVEVTEEVRRQMVANVIFVAGHDDVFMLQGNIDLCRHFGIDSAYLRFIAATLKQTAGCDIRKAAERLAEALEVGQ